MPPYKPQGTDWFLENKLTPPTTVAHGTDDSIRENLKSVNPRNWRVEGNQLIADTDWGELVQTIPTNYICEGTDDQGKPILTKIGE